MTELSDQQRAALSSVADGRVTWSDPHPGLTTRIGWSSPAWMIDGHKAAGSEGSTLDSLVIRRLVADVAEGETAHLTELGCRVLAEGSDG